MSDCGGVLQIYWMFVQGESVGVVQCVIFIGSYNISLCVSLDGKLFVYIFCMGGGFKLYVQDLQIGVVNVIMNINCDELLSFVVNGQYFLYVIQLGGCNVLVVVFFDGSVLLQILFVQGGFVCELLWGFFM